MRQQAQPALVAGRVPQAVRRGQLQRRLPRPPAALALPRLRGHQPGSARSLRGSRQRAAQPLRIRVAGCRRKAAGPVRLAGWLVQPGAQAGPQAQPAMEHPA